MLRGKCQADADVRAQRDALEVEGLGECSAQLHGRDHSLRAGRIGEHDRELVAAEAGKQITLTQLPGQARADAKQ